MSVSAPAKPMAPTPMMTNMRLAVAEPAAGRITNRAFVDCPGARV